MSTVKCNIIKLNKPSMLSWWTHSVQFTTIEKKLNKVSHRSRARSTQCLLSSDRRRLCCSFSAEPALQTVRQTCACVCCLLLGPHSWTVAQMQHLLAEECSVVWIVVSAPARQISMPSRRNCFAGSASGHHRCSTGWCCCPFSVWRTGHCRRRPPLKSLASQWLVGYWMQQLQLAPTGCRCAASRCQWLAGSLSR